MDTKVTFEKHPPEKGTVYLHPDRKEFIYITGGSYWVDGRLSNYYSFKKINSKGNLTRKEYGDYWRITWLPVKCKVSCKYDLDDQATIIKNKVIKVTISEKEKQHVKNNCVH